MASERPASLPTTSVHPFNTDDNLGFSDYPRLEEYGRDEPIPEDDAERHRAALELICSRGVPSYLTPYGSIRAVAAFAVGATDDAFHNDGKVLMKAALRARREVPEADRSSRYRRKGKGV